MTRFKELTRSNPAFAAASGCNISACRYRSRRVHVHQGTDRVNCGKPQYPEIAKLKEAGYIEVTKKFRNNYPQTLCNITALGKQKITEYIKILKLTKA